MSAIDATARGSGPYIVYVDGSEYSRHTTEREALENATEALQANPGAAVHYVHDYVVDVRLVGEAAPPVEPEPEPEPEPPVDPEPEEPAASLFYTDDLEDVPLGAGLAGRGANGFVWGSGRGAVVTDELGVRALRIQYGPIEPNGDPHWWQEQRFDMGRELREFGIEYQVYFPDGTEGVGSARFFQNRPDSANNLKFLALWAEDYQGHPLAISELWSHGTGPSHLRWCRGDYTQSDGLIRRPSHSPPSVVNGYDLVRGDQDLGRWIAIRHHIRLSDPGQSNGHFRTTADGRTIVDIKGDPFGNPAGPAPWFIRRGYLMGYDNNRFPENTWVYLRAFRFHAGDPGW